MISIRDALALIPPSKQKNARMLGFYSLTWLPITSAASNQVDTTTTQDDSDFIALRMKAYVTTTANPPVEVATPQLTFSLQVGATGSIMADGTPIHVGTFASSTAERRAYDFAFPLWLSKNTTLTGTLTNLFNADLNVRILLEGIRILGYAGAK